MYGSNKKGNLSINKLILIFLIIIVILVPSLIFFNKEDTFLIKDHKFCSQIDETLYCFYETSSYEVDSNIVSLIEIEMSPLKEELVLEIDYILTNSLEEIVLEDNEIYDFYSQGLSVGEDYKKVKIIKSLDFFDDRVPGVYFLEVQIRSDLKEKNLSFSSSFQLEPEFFPEAFED